MTRDEDLIANLQRLGDGEIDDLSIAHDALTEIVDLRIANSALRARLSQPEQRPEPVAFLADATRFKVTLTDSDCKITNLPRDLGGRWVALVAAEDDCHLRLASPPPQPEQRPEPVAWVEHHKGGDNLCWDDPGGKRTPLYASPPARDQSAALAIVHEQAEDEGLWFIAATAPEAYLQQALRRLHTAVEAAPVRAMRPA